MTIHIFVTQTIDTSMKLRGQAESKYIESVFFYKCIVSTSQVVLALRVHCWNRSKQAQEWIRHPMVTPSTPASGTVQPILHHPQTEPIRIKVTILN